MSEKSELQMLLGCMILCLLSVKCFLTTKSSSHNLGFMQYLPYLYRYPYIMYLQ